MQVIEKQGLYVSTYVNLCTHSPLLGPADKTREVFATMFTKMFMGIISGRGDWGANLTFFFAF